MTFPHIRFLLSFDSAKKISIEITSRHWGIVSSNVSLARWHFDCWWSLKPVKDFFELQNPVRKNASSLFFSLSSFSRCFLQIKHITLLLTSLKSNHLYSPNHCDWHNRSSLAKAVFGNKSVPSAWFGFPSTISVFLLLDDLLAPLTEVVVLTGLVSYVIFELVLTRSKGKWGVWAKTSKWKNQNLLIY